MWDALRRSPPTSSSSSSSSSKLTAARCVSLTATDGWRLRFEKQWPGRCEHECVFGPARRRSVGQLITPIQGVLGAGTGGRTPEALSLHPSGSVWEHRGVGSHRPHGQG